MNVGPINWGNYIKNYGVERVYRIGIDLIS